MATYTTNLKTWGSTGQIYPDNYSYVEGEQPVDAWDNFFNYNTIEDIQHLVDLTNARVADENGSEAQSGGVRLQNAEWLAARNAAGDGDVQMWSANASDQIAAGGVVKLGGDLLAEGGEIIWDESASEIPQGSLSDSSFTATPGDGLDGGGTVNLGGSFTFDVDITDLLGSGIEDDGSNNLRVASSAAGDGLKGGSGSALAIEPADFAGTYLSDDGTDNLTVDLGTHLENDGSGNIQVADDFILNSGDTMTGDFTIDSALFADQSTGDLDIAGELTEGTTI